jgi:hypothetical protein
MCERARGSLVIGIEQAVPVPAKSAAAPTQSLAG